MCVSVSDGLGRDHGRGLASHDSDGTVKGGATDVNNELTSLSKQNVGLLGKLEEALSKNKFLDEPAIGYVTRGSN